MPRIDSSRWMGALPRSIATDRPGTFTYPSGGYGTTSDYARILEAERRAQLIPDEVGEVRALAALLLPFPLMLWLAAFVLRSATPDLIVQDNGGLLVLWGIGVLALAGWQLASGSIHLLLARKTLLLAVMAGTVLVASTYVYLGFRSHARAAASAPERTYELYESRGGRSFRRRVSVHQRQDGSVLESNRRRKAVTYAYTCTLAQRLQGPNGFSWTRVLERSRSPGPGQLHWPIRPEECFSDIPLSPLPR